MKNLAVHVASVLGVVYLIISCSSTEFGGITGKKKPKPNTTPEPEGNIYEGEKENISDVIVGEECFVKAQELPESTVQPTELFNWQASGATASYNQVMATPVVGVIVDDKPSIVASTFAGSNCDEAGKIYAISGVDGTQQWVSTIDGFPESSAAIGDVDRDGKNEVIVSAKSGYIYALNGATGTVKWTSAEISDHNSPSIADIDEDGNPEVLVGKKVFNGADGTTKLTTVSNISFAMDVNPDIDGIEIITESRIRNGKTGDEICSFPATVMRGAAAARIKSTDRYATIIGKNTRGTFKGYNGNDCSELFSVAIPGGGGGPFNIADFDGDGELEFGTAGKTYYVVFESDGTEKWKQTTQDFSSNVTGSTTFDFNGDNKNEVVYNDELYLRVYNGETGAVIYETENGSGTLYEFPVVADVNGDGHANIVIASNDYAFGSHHGVRVFQAPENNWIGTRTIWNQHSYHVTNIGDDGAAADFEKKAIWEKWLKSNHLLGFRNNLPLRPIKPECLD